MLNLIVRQLIKGTTMIIIESVVMYKLLKRYNLISWRLWAIPILMVL